MGGLSKTYGRIIENLSVTYGNFIAKAWPTYGEIMALRSNKFIENLAINPVREHISKWPEFDSRSEQHFGDSELLPEAVMGSIPGRDTFSS